MHFPAEHLLDKLRISETQLRKFEEKGIVHGISKAGRVFYSARDIYAQGDPAPSEPWPSSRGSEMARRPPD